jgi:DNA-binding transcriptional ArsR family regulator
MPVLENPINTRLEILKSLYNLSGKRAGEQVRFYAAQIGGGYYGEILHQMRFLEEKGYIIFKKNIVSKRFFAELTGEGLAFMEDAYRILESDGPNKNEMLTEALKRIKI